MANAFDIDKVIKNGVDQNVDTHLLNETFHVFSKSPASNVTTLGGARLKSGHTTTASDVWADEIPAFFSAANQAKFDLFSTLAVKDDLCIFGGKVYQHNGTQFVSLGTEAEVLVDGATFQKNNKDVIKYHKNRTAINLTADNNNGDGSNNLSAKIYDAATGSTNFVSQFISSTDKMVAGVPSLAYDATVIADGVKLAEGLTNDNDYICNAYAGVIQFNKERSSGVTVSAWEYIGDKLTTSISSIRQSIKDISDVTLKGVVASVTADENTAQKAGIIVDNAVSTTPVIKFTAGSVTTGETKLVSGGAVAAVTDALAGRIAALEGVKLSVQVVDALPTTPVINTLYLVPEQGSTTGTYVEYIAYKPEGSETVTTERIGTTAVDLEGYTTDAEHKALTDRVTALDEATTGRVAVVEDKVSTLEGQVETITSTDATKDGSIAKALADAKSYVDTTALTPTTGSIAKYIETYVATNAKVSVNGQSATTITVKGTAEGAADLVHIKVTEDKSTTDKIGLTLTATLDAAVLNEDGSIDKDGVVIATIAKDIAETVADTAITNAITTDNGAIKDAIDSAISGATLADADNAIASAIGDAADKLVTAEQVKEYVTENTQVTISDGTTEVKSTGLTHFVVTGSTGDDITISSELEELVPGDGSKIGVVTHSATLSKATVDSSTGAITNGSLAVSANDAKTITDKAIAALSATGGAIAELATRVNAAEASASASEAAAEVAQGEATASKTAAEAAQAASEAAQSASESAASNASASATAASQSASAAKSAQDAAEAAQGEAAASAQSASSSAQSAADSEAAALQAAADAKAAKEFVETTAVWQAGTDDTLGNFTTNASGVVTGTTVKTVADEVLTLAKSYSDSLHTTSLDYVVLGDNETLPEASANTLGKIYLVASQNAPTADGAAISGAYVEYMTRKVGEGETATYTWEKIGTTAADLSGYAKSVTINGTKYEATAANAGALNLGTVVNGIGYNKTASNTSAEAPNALSIYATIRNDGILSIGIDDATDSVMGVSKMFTGSIDATGTATDTAVSVKSASGLYSVLASAIGSKVDTVQAGNYLKLAALQVTGDTFVTINANVIDDSVNVYVPEASMVVENGAIDGGAIFDTTKVAFTTQDRAYGFTYHSTSALVSFVGDMPMLECGYQMFANCPQLTTFIGDLSAMTGGTSMFSGCAKLTTFIGDLSSLEEGTNMFEGCNLSTETALEIVESLPTYTSGVHKITISVTSGSSALLAEIATLAESKGWVADLRTDGGIFS